ncbi:MAG: phospholipid carrier-dependent glycosyltransferase [Chloroflexi bacterium]|nr:MAG: phospholipid carrier-dependent glycosyltransferase [Chloroflexota bacterium]
MKFAVAALLALLAAQLVWEAWGDSLTFDETRYVRAGACAWRTGTIDLEVSNPPAVKLLSGAGVDLAGVHTGGCAGDAAFYWVSPDDLRRLILVARLPVIALALLLGLLVFWWGSALYGAFAGVVALGLVAVEPTLLAHAHLATGDLALSLAFVAALAAHWRWRQSRRRRWLLICGLAVGFGLLSKVNALLLLPLLGAIELVSSGGGVRHRLARLVGSGMIVAGCAWAAVCLVYLPFTQSHHDWGPPLAWVAPPSWFASLLVPVGDRGSGHVNYLNGVIAPGNQPFPQYFLEALALKTTLGLLFLVAAAALIAARRRDFIALLYLWLPITVVVGSASLGALDLGVRYVLPVYPLFALAAGSAAGALATQRLAVRVAVAGALLAVAASSFAHGQDRIGYFNELAGDRPERYLSDSNLDWGQDAWRLRDWWVASGQPPLSTAYFGTLTLDHYGIEATPVQPATEPVHGLLAVSLTRKTIIGDSQLPYAGRPYRFLEGRRLLARIGSSIEVYDLG